MSRKPLAIMLLVLFTIALAPSLGAASPAPESPRSKSATAAQAARGATLANQVLTLLRNIVEKTGCAIDPLGRCVPAPTAIQSVPVCPGDDREGCTDRR